MNLLLLALAPVFILLTYVYFRDKYEKEPLGLILRGFLAGAFITVPIVLAEKGLMSLNSYQGLGKAAYTGFIVAGTTEEFFKFLILCLLFWRNRNFNERFDGIVYAVSVSLGFAAVENILFVYNGSYQVGLLRAVTAVPVHALLGVIMGFYLGLARFVPGMRNSFLLRALLVPLLLHGAYDFFILSGKPFLIFGFVPVLIFLWIAGIRLMKKHSDASLFRRTPPPPPDSSLS